MAEYYSMDAGHTAEWAELNREDTPSERARQRLATFGDQAQAIIDDISAGENMSAVKGLVKLRNALRAWQTVDTTCLNCGVQYDGRGLYCDPCQEEAVGIMRELDEEADAEARGW